MKSINARSSDPVKLLRWIEINSDDLAVRSRGQIIYWHSRDQGTDRPGVRIDRVEPDCRIDRPWIVINVQKSK